jgi:hypothetical protein
LTFRVPKKEEGHRKIDNRNPSTKTPATRSLKHTSGSSDWIGKKMHLPPSGISITLPQTKKYSPKSTQI